MDAFFQIDTAKRKSGLRAAFDSRSEISDSGPPDIGVAGLLAVLREVGMVDELVQDKVEAFVRAGVTGDVRLPYSAPKPKAGAAGSSFYSVEDAFDKVISFEHGFSNEMVNEIVDDIVDATRLTVAVEEDNLERVEKLLLLGANANHTTLDGSTPLHIACEKGSTEVVRALSFCGADAHADSCGETPFGVACGKGHTGCVEELCLSQADPNRQHIDGSAGLHMAAQACPLDVGPPPSHSLIPTLTPITHPRVHPHPRTLTPTLPLAPTLSPQPSP